MRKIGVKEIEDISIGATLLGSGGGGDPYIGKLMAINAIQKYGEVTLLSPSEVPDNALIVPIGGIGAPLIILEKGCSLNNCQQVYDMFASYTKQKIFAFMPIEAGGVNSMFPFVAAATLGLPVIDADAMGRAFPEIQMTTFTIGNISASPIAVADEKGNSAVFNSVNDKWAENLIRSFTTTCGGSVLGITYSVTGKQLKDFAIHDIVTRCEKIGNAIKTKKELNEGYKLFTGKIVDIVRETTGGFNFGKITIEGLDNFSNKRAVVGFQNENLLLEVDNQVKVTTPDLICIVDKETFMPCTTESLKYGKRVSVFGLKCHKAWRSKKGLELVGPRYFGYNIDYKPVEELCTD